MSAISYSVFLGGNLETVQVGTAANTNGNGGVEIRFDQTTNAITDASVPGGTRPLKRGEVQALLRVLEEKLLNDPSVFQ